MFGNIESWEEKGEGWRKLFCCQLFGSLLLTFVNVELKSSNNNFNNFFSSYLQAFRILLHRLASLQANPAKSNLITERKGQLSSSFDRPETARAKTAKQSPNCINSRDCSKNSSINSSDTPKSPKTHKSALTSDANNNLVDEHLPDEHAALLTSQQHTQNMGSNVSRSKGLTGRRTQSSSE